MVNNRAEILDADLSRRRVFPLVVRAPDHLTVAVAAAGQKDALGLWPVVAAGILVDLRRVAKLPGDDDERVVEEPLVGEIGDQRPHRRVVAGELVFEGRADVAMVVEVAGVERDIANPRLDEPAGHERLLPPAGAVAIAEGLRLLRNVERLAHLARENQVHRLLLGLVHLIKRPLPVDAALEVVELAAERHPVDEPLFRQPVGEGEALGVARRQAPRLVAVAEGAVLEGIVIDAEPGGAVEAKAAVIHVHRGK